MNLDPGIEPGEHDTWALDSREYSPNKFYTKSTDGRGNSEGLSFKVTPFELGLLGMLVESPDFPDYRTKADFLRDAIAHRLHHIAEMAGDETRMAEIRRRTELHRQETEVERIKVAIQQQIRHADALTETMQLGFETGNPEGLSNAIEAAEQALDYLPFNLADKLRRVIGEKSRELRYMQARAAIDAEELEAHS